MDIKNTLIEPERFYHIYNHGVNGETIFKTKKNYPYFPYKTILSNTTTFLKREDLLDLYRDQENSVFCYKKETSYEF